MAARALLGQAEPVVRVVRVAVEVAGTVMARPFPKSKAARRSIPLPAFVVQLLAMHQQEFPPGPADEVFTNTAGGHFAGLCFGLGYGARRFYALACLAAV